MTRPTFCRRIVRPFVNPDAADDPWCWGVPDAWEHGCLPPSPRPQGCRVRASMLQEALDVQRDEPMCRPRLDEARVQCPGARPCGPLRLQPARQRRRPVFEATARRRSPRSERRSPSALPQPATPSRPKARVSGPPAASPYPILHGVSRRLCAALRLVAGCGGGRGANGGARPYARDRRPAQPLRWLPRGTRAGGGALVAGKVAQSTVAVRHGCLPHNSLRVFRNAGGSATAQGNPPPPTTRRRVPPATGEG